MVGSAGWRRSALKGSESERRHLDLENPGFSPEDTVGTERG